MHAFGLVVMSRIADVERLGTSLFDQEPIRAIRCSLKEIRGVGASVKVVVCTSWSSTRVQAV